VRGATWRKASFGTRDYLDAGLADEFIQQSIAAGKSYGCGIMRLLISVQG
jgi:uncharacterized protein (DUF736 family)